MIEKKKSSDNIDARETYVRHLPDHGVRFVRQIGSEGGSGI